MTPFTLWRPRLIKHTLRMGSYKTITHIYADNGTYKPPLACTVFHNINSRGTLRFFGKLYYPK